MKANSKNNKPKAAFAICIIHWLNEPRWRWWRRRRMANTTTKRRHTIQQRQAHFKWFCIIHGKWGTNVCEPQRKSQTTQYRVFRVHTQIQNVLNCLDKIATSTEKHTQLIHFGIRQCVCVWERERKWIDRNIYRMHNLKSYAHKFSMPIKIYANKNYYY